MHVFETKVLNFIKENNMLKAGDKVVLGVSGGADSTALLMVLIKLSERFNLKLKVVHINHGLRKEADSEARYVKSLCDQNSIEFVLKKYDVKSLALDKGLGLEEMGRILRYEAFAEALGDEGGKIAVAHNMNDLSETMLFHLFRGTGVKGLSSIQPVRDNVIRPLLNVSRAEIEQYLTDISVSFCTDKSNFSNDYTRNKIRNIIIPDILNNITQSAISHMAETASQLREIDDYIDKQTNVQYKNCLIRENDNEVVFDKKRFDILDNLIKKTLTKKAIDILVPKNKDITHIHLNSLLSLESGNGYREISLPYNLKAFVSYDEIGVRKIAKESNVSFSYELPLSGELSIPEVGVFKINSFVKPCDYIPSQKKYTKSMDYDKINGIVMVRNRREGDYLTVNMAGGKKKLKDYFINEKIPVGERNSIPIVACGSDVIWVVGHRISENVKVSDETKHILEITFIKEEE